MMWPRKPTRLLIAPYNHLADFIFPPLCVVCSQPRNTIFPWLCDDCIAKLDKNNKERNACPRCSLNNTYRTCACAYAWDHPFERIHALFDFDDTVKTLVHQIKYQGRSRLAFDLGRHFAPAIPQDFLNGIDAVIAIPLHPLKHLHRGYNQAESCLQGIANGLSIPLTNLGKSIRRIRNTRTQTRLDREERSRNLDGAFALNRRSCSLINNRGILLIDDVVTTGATSAACTTLLLEAGATRVRVLSLARD